MEPKIFRVWIKVLSNVLPAAVYGCSDKFKASTLAKSVYGISELRNGKQSGGVVVTKTVEEVGEEDAEFFPIVLVGEM